MEAIPEPPPANLTANGTANDTATANVTVSGNATVVINGTETAGGEASKEGEEPAKAAGEEAAPADEKEEEAAAAPEKEGEEAEAAAAAEEEPAGKADATKKAEPEAAPDAAKGAPAKNKTALDAAEEAIAAASKFRRRTIKVALNVTGSLAFTGLNRTQFEVRGAGRLRGGCGLFSSRTAKADTRRDSHRAPPLPHPAPSAPRLQASRKALRELARADEVKRDTARSKNDLEAYIIDMRDKVGAAEEEGSEEEGAAAMRAASTPEERGSFTEALTAAEDWLYGDGDLAAAAEYRTQLRALRDVGDAITRRVEELGARPAAAKAARAYLESTRKAVGKWASAKPWINATEVEALLAKVRRAGGLVVVGRLLGWRLMLLQRPAPSLCMPTPVARSSWPRALTDHAPAPPFLPAPRSLTSTRSGWRGRRRARASWPTTRSRPSPRTRSPTGWTPSRRRSPASTTAASRGRRRCPRPSPPTPPSATTLRRRPPKTARPPGTRAQRPGLMPRPRQAAPRRAGQAMPRRAGQATLRRAAMPRRGAARTAARQAARRTLPPTRSLPPTLTRAPRLQKRSGLAPRARTTSWMATTSCSCCPSEPQRAPPPPPDHSRQPSSII